MDSRIVAVCCLCDDMLKALHHRDDLQCRMMGAEVTTTAIVAALDYGGNLEKARRMLHREGYIPRMLGKRRFNRRWLLFHPDPQEELQVPSSSLAALLEVLLPQTHQNHGQPD